ncbi:hypothetical protein GCM10009850_065660 [Nonomuraea monospora]|uniref:Uncharacterized protein n=1 Tax=Nonomuraea monospora TaxID=568818 RepID=A0ABP5PJZ0_9ACTN
MGSEPLAWLKAPRAAERAGLVGDAWGCLSACVTPWLTDAGRDASRACARL